MVQYVQTAEVYVKSISRGQKLKMSLNALNNAGNAEVYASSVAESLYEGFTDFSLSSFSERMLSCATLCRKSHPQEVTNNCQMTKVR